MADYTDRVNWLRGRIREVAAELARLRCELAHIQKERYRSMVAAFEQEIREILKGGDDG